MKHILFTLYECDSDLLDDHMFIEDVLREAASVSGATYLNTITHKFTPHGVTAVTLLAESHISIHTWPEHGYAVCDIFTCGDADPSIGMVYMSTQFKSKRISKTEFNRQIDQ